MTILMRTCGLLLVASAWLATPASAADRVRAGQWEVKLDFNGRSMVRSVCISAADAALINGDAASLRAYTERINEGTGCKVTDVKTQGSSVSVKSVCASGKENTGTTTYSGDRYETVNTNGAKAQAHRIGDCK